MSNRVEPEIPNITLDQDQVKTSRAQSAGQHKKVSEPLTAANASSSTANNIFTIIIYLALAGAAWFFYQENLKLQSAIAQSEERIQLLENQLSATGEEMGESTVALKIKLEAITEKTEKLWEEMDKLWASAWRRNQSEIKDLSSASKKQDTTIIEQAKQLQTALTGINGLKDKLTSTEFNIEALAEKMTAANNVQSELTKLAAKLASLEEKSSGRDSQQMEVATNVNQLDLSLTLLIERLEKLEKSQLSTNSIQP